MTLLCRTYAQKKPILRIAHHRLEGKVEKLAIPYALLRTRPRLDDNDSSADGRPTKRARTSPPPTGSISSARVDKGVQEKPGKQIEIVALIRHKLVFSKRPEPLIEVSSEADPTFETRKRAALESNKGVKGPRGAAAAAAAAAATAATATATTATTAESEGDMNAPGAAGKVGNADAGAAEVDRVSSGPLRKPANAGKASSFFAPRKPAAAQPADGDTT